MNADVSWPCLVFSHALDHMAVQIYTMMLPGTWNVQLRGNPLDFVSGFSKC